VSISSTYHDTSVENFDPNKPGTRQPVWGVYDGSRFKTFAQRGHALNRTTSNRCAKLFEYVGGFWVLRVHKRAAPGQVCDECQGSVMETRRRYDYQTHTYHDVPGEMVNGGKWEWRRQRGKIINPPELVWCCKACADLLRNS
jgi:hypothetical protein